MASASSNVPGTLSQGAALAEYANGKGYKKAYTTKSKDEGYTQSLANAFAARFKDLGGEIVGEGRFNIGDTNFRVTATKMVEQRRRRGHDEYSCPNRPRS